MSQLELTTDSPEQTQRFGARLGKMARPGDVFLLVGELGAGKTCLTQGITWGLKIKEYAASPSFVLVRELKGRLPLYHIDFYRLENLEDEIGGTRLRRSSRRSGRPSPERLPGDCHLHGYPVCDSLR